MTLLLQVILMLYKEKLGAAAELAIQRKHTSIKSRGFILIVFSVETIGVRKELNKILLQNRSVNLGIPNQKII